MLVIIEQPMKIVYYKPVNVTINAPSLLEIIIDVIVRYHKVPTSIVINQGSLFTSKFWSL